MNFLEKLDLLINKHNINKSVLSKQSGVPYTTIDGFYKKGYQNAKLPTIQKIASYFNVTLDYLMIDEITDPSFGKINNFNIVEDEMYFIKKIRTLTPFGRIAIEENLNSMLKYESELKKMQIKESPTEIYQISVPTTTRSYAAGAGSIVYDGDDQVTDINYPSDRVPKETDFASRVEGDSMEPTFIDGDIIFVKHAEILKIGEIGLFNINGENYIKECGKDGLISHNKKYPLITPTSQDTLVCIGRVLGKL